MANNRMFLVHDETGQKVCIARHFAGEWVVFDGIKEYLTTAFEAEARANGIGSTGWHLEFSNHTMHDDPLKSTATTCWQDERGEWHDGNRPAGGAA